MDKKDEAITMEKVSSNIKSWLAEKGLRVTEDEDDKNGFHLVVRPQSDRALPIDIIGSKETDKKILVCWIWGIFEEDRKALESIDINIRKAFESEVKLGLELMNLPIVFYESIDDLKAMSCQKYILTNQLTKENLMNVIRELLDALTFTSRKFIDHFSMPVEFDPSSHV